MDDKDSANDLADGGAADHGLTPFDGTTAESTSVQEQTSRRPATRKPDPFLFRQMVDQVGDIAPDGTLTPAQVGSIFHAILGAEQAATLDLQNRFRKHDYDQMVRVLILVAHANRIPYFWRDPALNHGIKLAANSKTASRAQYAAVFRWCLSANFATQDGEPDEVIKAPRVSRNAVHAFGMHCWCEVEGIDVCSTDAEFLRVKLTAIPRNRLKNLALQREKLMEQEEQQEPATDAEAGDEETVEIVSEGHSRDDDDNDELEGGGEETVAPAASPIPPLVQPRPAKPAATKPLYVVRLGEDHRLNKREVQGRLADVVAAMTKLLNSPNVNDHASLALIAIPAQDDEDYLDLFRPAKGGLEPFGRVRQPDARPHPKGEAADLAAA